MGNSELSSNNESYTRQLARTLDAFLSSFFLTGSYPCVVIFFLLGIMAVLFPQELLTVDSGNVKADPLVVLGGGSIERPERASELSKANAAPKSSSVEQVTALLTRACWKKAACLRLLSCWRPVPSALWKTRNSQSRCCDKWALIM